MILFLPFWTMNTTEYKEPKLCKYGFYGSTKNHKIRVRLVQHFVTNSDFRYRGGLSEEIYLRMSSETIFNFCPRGAGLSSWRFFESMHLNTIPVLFADDTVLPFEDSLDYSKICVRLPEDDTNSDVVIMEKLESVDINAMLEQINLHKSKFTLLGAQTETHDKLIAAI